MTAHPPCGASKKQGEGTCARPAGWGTSHVGTGRCKLHGGASPNGTKAAWKEIARNALETFGLPVTTEPHQALMDELYRTAGHVAWLGGMVQGMEEGELRESVGFVDQDGNWHKQPDVPDLWIRLYQEERAHLTKVAKTCIDAGIAERQVRIAEAQGLLLAQVIKSVLTKLSIDPTSQKARDVVRKELTSASGPETAIMNGSAKEKEVA